MPELPEMEVYKQNLQEQLLGEQITNVVVNREKSLNMEQHLFRERILAKKVIAVDRCAKHMLFRLESGDTLLLHLMLGGWMYLGHQTDQPDRTKQITLTFTDKDLFFIGLRLGYLHLLSSEQVKERLEDLGPDPLNPTFSQHQFEQLIKQKRGMLKPTLVDQHFLSGIGNCYSDEICFVAKVRPSRKFPELNDQEIKQLYNAIGDVMKNAIKQGGYMAHPFHRHDTLTGHYQPFVYDKEGEACPRCGTNIVKAEIGSRKTFYCPNCQI